MECLNCYQETNSKEIVYISHLKRESIEVPIEKRMGNDYANWGYL